MFRLVRLIFKGDGHAHVWERIMTHNLSSYGGNSVFGIVHHMRCKVCGNIKFKKFVNRG